jgi:hypothetical protein
MFLQSNGGLACAAVRLRSVLRDGCAQELERASIAGTGVGLSAATDQAARSKMQTSLQAFTRNQAASR